MNKKLWFIFSGIFFFLSFILFSYLVNKEVFIRFDKNVTIFLQSNISHIFDQPFSCLSLVGSFEVCLLFLVIFLIIRRKVISGLITLGLFGVIHVFELYGKTFVRHPGPPSSILRYDLAFNFPSAFVQPGSSYPSGHAARAFFITTMLVMLALESKTLTKNKKIFIIVGLGCYDIVMCISRIYLAEHWTTDIIGGSLSGIGLALMATFAL